MVAFFVFTLIAVALIIAFGIVSMCIVSKESDTEAVNIIKRNKKK